MKRFLAIFMAIYFSGVLISVVAVHYCRYEQDRFYVEYGPMLFEVHKKFVPQLTDIKSSYTIELETLAKQAAKEYKAQSKNGVFSSQQFIKKYIELARQIENKHDRMFYKVVSEFEVELLNLGFPTDAIYKEQKSYNRYKSDVKSKLIHKYRKALAASNGNI